jgi:CopG family transcriptional regulator, nickel-responsive regulator
MEASLLKAFDAVVRTRQSTRSKAVSDLARSAILSARADSNVAAVGVLMLVYDHHVRELTERLTELQHQLGEAVRATLHVHLDHHNCLEVTVLQGKSNDLRRLSERILGMRGVKQGTIEIVAGSNSRAGLQQPHRSAAGSSKSSARRQRDASKHG